MCKVFYSLPSELSIKISDHECSKLIIISGNDDTFLRSFRAKIKKLTDQCTFSDLNTVSKKNILQKEIMFQNNRIHLAALIDTDTKNFTDKLNADIITRLLSGNEVVFAKELPPEMSFFASCQLLRHTKVKLDILFDEKQVAKFIFTGTITEKLKPLMVEPGVAICDLRSTKNEVQQDCCYFLMRDENSAEEFLNSSDQVVHWFEIDEENSGLMWRQSNVDVKIIRKYLDVTEDSKPFSTRNVKDIKHKTVSIVSEPGSGKSTLLKHVAHEIKCTELSTWVLCINLIEYMENSSKMYDLNELKKYLGVTGRLEAALFDHILYQTGNAVVLVDEFDAASPNRTEETVRLLRTIASKNIRQLWVTSRPIMLDCLEREMQSFSYSLAPFTEQEQVDFLVNCWTEEGKSGIDLRRFASILIKRTNALSVEHKMFTSVPMHIMMLAELFKEKSNSRKIGFA
jgi:hypothetical protein